MSTHHISKQVVTGTWLSAPSHARCLGLEWLMVFQCVASTELRQACLPKLRRLCETASQTYSCAEGHLNQSFSCR